MVEPTAQAFIQIEKVASGWLRQYIKTRFVMSGMQEDPKRPLRLLKGDYF